MPGDERLEKLKATWLFGKSGAEDTRSPDALRMLGGFEPREASGVRRVHRRFRMGETILAPVPQWRIQAQGHSRLTW